MKPGVNHLLSNICSLQQRVNNLSVEKKKTRFKVKPRNLIGPAIIDTGNLVHSAIVSGEFWEAIGGKISSSMDCKVGTADGQSKGLQVAGYRRTLANISRRKRGMLYPRTLVIRGLSHV